MEKEKSFNFEMVFKWSVILAVAIMAFIAVSYTHLRAHET